MFVAFVVNPHRLFEISPTLRTEPAHTHWETAGDEEKEEEKDCGGFRFRPDSHRTFEGIFTQTCVVYVQSSTNLLGCREAIFPTE